MALILGIETSCDETGVAIFDSNKGLLANTLHSQIELHNLYGGVVPELASRDHITRIIPLIEECLKLAKLTIDTIDAFAYTAGPGLNGALLIGASVANGIAYSLGKPVIPIHHLEGHLLSPLLSNEQPSTPFLALLVSGGHSQLIAVEEIGKYTVLGDTLDDAAGEAFDKTAKMLELPYPGGKHIAQMAKNGEDVYHLPRPMLNSKTLEMSFSGLKTAVAVLIQKLGGANNLDNTIKHNLAKSIEESITDVLVRKTHDALQQTGIKNLVVSGGVSANLTLRKKLSRLVQENGVMAYYPPLDLCTDNGAMIALAGVIRYNQRITQYDFNVNPRWKLSKLGPVV